MVATCSRVQVRVQAAAAGGVSAWSPPTAVLGRPAPPTLASQEAAAPAGEEARAEVTVSGAASDSCEVEVEAAGGEVELHRGPGPACPRPSGGCCTLARLHTRLQLTLATCTTFTLRARCSNYLNLSQVYWPGTYGKYFFRVKIFFSRQNIFSTPGAGGRAAAPARQPEPAGAGAGLPGPLEAGLGVERPRPPPDPVPGRRPR